MMDFLKESGEAKGSLELAPISAPESLNAGNILDASQEMGASIPRLGESVGTKLLSDSPSRANQVKSREKTVTDVAQQIDVAGIDDLVSLGWGNSLSGHDLSTYSQTDQAVSKRTTTLLPSAVAILLKAKVTATPLETSGAKDYHFSVVLPEGVGLDVLPKAEMRVMGPYDYCQTAAFVGMQGDTLRYRVSAPRDTWTQADNGVYRIYLAMGSAPTPIQAFSVVVADKAGQRNLLQNGDFKSGLTSWVTFEGTERISEASTPIGNASLVLSTQESGTSQTIRVSPGAIYQLTGYGCSIDEGYRSFGMSFFDGKGRLLSRSDVGCIRSGKWKDYFVVAIAPTHATDVQVWTYQGCGQGCTIISALSLRQITPENIPPRLEQRFSLVNAPLSPAHPLYARWQMPCNA